MRLQIIYKSDINRDINGVIKVAQNDEQSMEQELREYIITRELRRHFNTFLNNYEKSLNQPTDKIGVWISGFFGSGKSHFLKMLSYLLSNGIVAGKHAVDYFADKFDDPMMFAQLETCVKVPTETILFNIDSKSPLTKDKTAILRVFAKVFYEHQGFYGNDLKIAKLEQFIARSGKMEQFESAFEEINGDSWKNAREAYAFFEDDVVAALTASLGMSETSARNWFNGEDETSLSIEQLVKEIREYIDSKGKNFRLLFMIDEVGQYIGSDSDLMLNLQTIVEEIGTKCGGRVWVMVTSQEAIDSITKISGDDFSKIQGRFNTRLSLSSSSVDEVIKKRILAKNEHGEALLKLSFEKNHSVLRNLFTFNSAVLDLKGYAGEGEFIETYPFVPYQFRLMQNVLAQIRKHGNSGKHLSGGERSMLSGFQEAAQAIQNRDENAIIPFYLFYNTVHTFLEGSIRRVIDRCQVAADHHDGVEPYDVNILKLLYLVRYVDDVKANIDNICILMADDIRTDKISKRLDVQQSLDRLVSQNYVSRSGDTYTFLTDDEQDIAREIRNTPVDSAMITQAISNIIFGDLYASKKFKYGEYDFPYDQIIDETAVTTLTGSVRLHFITVASDIYSTDDAVFLMKSAAENEAMVVLSDSQPYFKELEDAMKIRKYVKGKNVAQLPEVIQRIIRSRQQDASAHEDRARELIIAAIADSRIYVAGEKLHLKISGIKERINHAMTVLIESVYTKLSYIRKNYSSDEDLLQILSGENRQLTLDGMESPNADAFKEMLQYFEMQRIKQLPTSMGNIQKRYAGIPYGWREIDIAAVIAELIVAQKITIKYCGSVVQPKDRKLPDYLRRKTEIDKTLVSLRQIIDPRLIKQSRELMSEYFNTGITEIPTGEDALISRVIERFTEERDRYTSLVENEYAVSKYPGKSLAEKGVQLCNDLLAHKKDNTALLKKLTEMEDELLDFAEDIADVLTFFRVQKTIFDNAYSLLTKYSSERDYLQTEDVATRNLSEISSILEMPKPYKRISDLPALMQETEEIYAGLLGEKRKEIFSEIRAAMEEIQQTANEKQADIVCRADDALQQKKRSAEIIGTLTALDAMKIQIANIRQQYLQKLVILPDSERKTVTISRSTICHTKKLESEADVDKYLAEIKKALMGKMEGFDVLHII